MIDVLKQALDYVDTETTAMLYLKEIVPEELSDLGNKLRQAISVYKSAPPEAQTEAEKTAYTFGWFKALEVQRAEAEKQEPVAWLCEPDENGLYGLPLTEGTCTKCFPVYRHPQSLQQEPVVIDHAPIYYMRDNHTFKKLSTDVITALVEIENEFNDGWIYGMLCSKQEGFPTIHANGDKDRLRFFAECKTVLEQAYGIKETK